MMPRVDIEAWAQEQDDAAREKVLDALIAFAREYGRLPLAYEWSPALARAGNKGDAVVARFDARREEWPHYDQARRLFGSWTAALTETGITAEQIRRGVEEIMPDEEPLTKEVAAVLVASLGYGTCEPHLSAVLGTDLDDLCVWGTRLRDNGVWQEDGTIVCDWFHPEHGGMALILDVCVALGDIVRVSG